MIEIGNSWQSFMDEEFQKDYYKELRGFLAKEYKTQTIYPDMKDIFNVFKLTPLENVKVIILGQDPYHGKGQGMGLSFSVRDEVKVPPSLRNIYTEIIDDTAPETINVTNGNLTRWAKQGVFLLNTVLTVREKQPNSHRGKGWEIFTDNAIKILNDDKSPKVFMLWGANAKAKEPLLTNKEHLILKAAHPSPFSAHNGFFGCKHFSKANDFLVANGITPIVW